MYPSSQVPSFQPLVSLADIKTIEQPGHLPLIDGHDLLLALWPLAPILLGSLLPKE